MRLKDVAADTGLDISTISRVSNSKYVQSEFGIFPLKFFFSESMQTTEGEEVSVREIKSIIKELIEQEDKNNTLTDDALVKLLQEKGYKIARRTVAKYREQLHIPTSRQRSNA
jgi:RNA polymerase sigma-54 factor